MAEDQLSAIVIGGTGATGSQLVKQLLASEKWGKVTAIGRRPVEGEAEKLVQVTADFEKLEETKSQWAGHDVVFNCLGTTRRQAGGPRGFVKIEVTYSENAARMAKEAGIKHFSVVSAQGANANVWAIDLIHPLLYMKTLGQKEQVALQQNFERTTIFRPGMLERHKGDRWHEDLAVKVIPSLSVIKLAQAMILDAESAARLPVVYYDTAAVLKMTEAAGPPTSEL
jgi:oxidoreductase